MTGRHPLIWATQPDGRVTALAPDGGRYTLTQAASGAWWAEWQPFDGSRPPVRLAERTDKPTLEGVKSACKRHAPTVPLYKPATHPATSRRHLPC